HLKEVNEQLTIVALQESLPPLFFIPQRGNFSRGIFATLYTAFNGTLEEAQELYKNFYDQAPFTHISLKPIDLKAVVNTNNCQLHLHKYQDQLLITVAIDNLLKGASGQAIQNMNLVLGMEEILGLSLKGSAF
ncbi:MAG: N-acetyl-gamma-glutamyl-phosphate reductase, partial [Colwellia sp.]